MKKVLYAIIITSILSSFSCIKNLSGINRDFEKKLKELTTEIKTKYSHSSQKVKRIAVLSLVNEDGDVSKLGVTCSDIIQEYMFDPKMFTLLERNNINSLLGEHKFNQSGLVSNLSVKKLGNMLGAELVMVGTISHANNQFKINSRIVDLESGSILSIAHINTDSTKSLLELYNSINKRKEITLNGAYEFIVEEIVVKERKSDGRNWDGGLNDNQLQPDLFYKIYKNNKLVYPRNSDDPERVRNSFTADFSHVKAKIILEKDDVISVLVSDKDVLIDDDIGEVILPPARLLRIINNEENIFSAQQVDKIRIKIKKIE